MRRFSFAAMLLAAAGLALAGFAGAARAQAAPDTKSTPKNWAWEIRDGKRVPKANRINNPDGSWREEVRHGSCVTLRERTASGEYKEVRRCD